MNLSNSPKDRILADPKVIADSLMHLTSSWSPAPGVTTEALITARKALARSLVAGKNLLEIHASKQIVRDLPDAKPKLEKELLKIASDVVAEKKPSSIAIIRTPSAATVSNPLGTPSWAGSANVKESFGPFVDLSGFPNWVDVIPLTSSISNISLNPGNLVNPLTPSTSSYQFAFGDPSAPFGLFPVSRRLVTPTIPTSNTDLKLGPGNFWFLANWLASTLPANAFTGFSITGGTLVSSQAFSLVNGVYIIPNTATLTVKVTLAAAQQPSAAGKVGLDASSAVFTPPSELTMVFKKSSAAFQSIASASAVVYGSKMTMAWNTSGIKVEVVNVSNILNISEDISEVLMPCTVSPTSFSFLNTTSEIFKPSGKASINMAGWALSLVTTSITSLSADYRTGSAFLHLTGGASLKTNVQPVTVMSEWGIEVFTGILNISTRGQIAAIETTFQLWPETTPSKLNSTVKFSIYREGKYGYFSSPNNEILNTSGIVETQLDRPLTATGKRFDYSSNASLLIIQNQTETSLCIIGDSNNNDSTIITLALENALVGVEKPISFFLSGTLTGTQVQNCYTLLSFVLRSLLPILPDPYASNFNLLTWTPDPANKFARTVTAKTSWADQKSKPQLEFTLNIPDFNVTDNHFLLDLSTRVDLLGVGYFGKAGEAIAVVVKKATDVLDNSAPPIAFSGMSLELNSAKVGTFALPQFSWEPMISDPKRIECLPPSDGYPLIVLVPNNQELVPLAPEPVLMNNIRNVADGKPFRAVFTLPFGLTAVINQQSSTFPNTGRFSTNSPHFPNSTLSSSASVDPNLKSALTNPPQELTGALSLSLKPENSTNPNSKFLGYTSFYNNGYTPSYGLVVLGYDTKSKNTNVGNFFDAEFGTSGWNKGVPLRRIDFSGYGASTFSEWIDENPPGDQTFRTGVKKVHFEACMGRTALEVIQVEKLVLPYCPKLVRTIVIKRKKTGWMKQTDSNWQPLSDGRFEFPYNGPTDPFAKRKHLGPLTGVFNIRNIREDPTCVPFTVYDKDTKQKFKFMQLLFDADLELDESLKVISGGFKVGNSTRVPSKDMVGFMQMEPDTVPPSPGVLDMLFQQVGPLKPEISCTVEVGSFNGNPGPRFRCSALEVNTFSQLHADPDMRPAMGIALRGVPQIPHGVGWSMGKRSIEEPAPSELPRDTPVPLVKPYNSNDFWYIADIDDILLLNTKDNYIHDRSNFYSLLHSTGTQKLLFEAPQIPTSSTASQAHPAPGLQFPNTERLFTRSPSLGDLASVLSSTTLFPDIASSISLSPEEIEHINTNDEGLKYLKKYTFNPADGKRSIYGDSGDQFKIEMAYEYFDSNKNLTVPTELIYFVDSAKSPSWSLSIGNFSQLVTVSAFGDDPLLTISGLFYADEHTAPGITDLNLQLGDSLKIVKQVFSAIQMLAQFLPGGSGASLDVALSNGKLLVSDSFTIGDLPLGMGNLTDVSLNMGLNVELQSRKAGFIVSIGSPDKPFNWIATPLAGNGFMSFGWQDNSPAVTIQAGIGLGVAIDLGIAKGSASVVLAVRLDQSLQFTVILTGRADVEVLDGVASASLTLSAALGCNIDPDTPIPKYSTDEIRMPDISVTLIGTISVGIHISICWVVSVDWDGSWQFSQTIKTPTFAVKA